MRAFLAILLLARVALAGPSTTVDWSETWPMDGQSTGNIVGTSHPFCVSWVPTIGITNATSLSAYVMSGAAGGSKCSFTIYDAGGSVLIATTGAVACDVSNAVFQATGLTPFSLAAGVKYQRCWCGNGTPALLGYNTNFGADFGRGIRNTLSVPLRFTGGTLCGGDGSSPSTLGTFTAADASPAFVLIGTSAP